MDNLYVDPTEIDFLKDMKSGLGSSNGSRSGPRAKSLRMQESVKFKTTTQVVSHALLAAQDLREERAAEKKEARELKKKETSKSFIK